MVIMVMLRMMMMMRMILAACSEVVLDPYAGRS